jgi:hypothetical protein
MRFLQNSPSAHLISTTIPAEVWILGKRGAKEGERRVGRRASA